MGIGENILFIYKGEKEWQGVSNQVMRSENHRLTDFIFASDLLKNMRNVVIENDIEFEHKKNVESIPPIET
jgi:phospholipid/cholesterol/gamma-HCH transport system ATP-binding protein